MFKNKKEVEEVLVLSKRVLKIASFLLLFVSFYLFLKITKELLIWEFLLTILKILSPLFIGLLIAWLLEPLVKYLKEKGFKRLYGALVVYLILLFLLVILLSLIIPLFLEQIDDFARGLPLILTSIKSWINNIIDKFGKASSLNMLHFKKEIFNSLEQFGNNLPLMISNFLGIFIQKLGLFIVALVIGFYFLIGFDSNDNFLNVFPLSLQDKARDLLNEFNTSMRKFVQGMFLTSFLIFIVCGGGFYFIGLKGALLFSFICGITNVIPFIGPYIGGVPVIIVAFSQSLRMGVMALLIIVVVQFIESMLVQPLLMSRMMKLHLITIMAGLLIFGYYWGGVGMILATPIIATGKLIINYFYEKGKGEKYGI